MFGVIRYGAGMLAERPWPNAGPTNIVNMPSANERRRTDGLMLTSKWPHSYMGRRPTAGVYFGRSDFSLVSSSKERRMGSKRLNRRALIKSGAAIAGGLTLGAAAPAMGAQQTADAHHGAPPSWPMIKGDKD